MIRKLSRAALPALCLAFPAFAQCATPIAGTAIGNGDDVVLPAQALGFAFPFGGTSYTHVHVCTNGFVYLSNAGTPAPGGPLCCDGDPAELVTGSPKIAPFWADLDVDPARNGTVWFEARPGRAIVTWQNVIEYSDEILFDMQVEIAATGAITFTYSADMQVRATHDFLAGMSPGGGASQPTASDYATNGTAAAATHFETFLGNGSFDLAGRSLQFTPTGGGYSWSSSPCPQSSVTTYGHGCYALTRSFYQWTGTTAASAAALANTAITLIPSGSDYVVIAGGTFVPPSAGATALTLFDDDSVATPNLSTPFPYPGGTTASFTVCSNGSVWVANGNDEDYAPNIATMLANPQTGWYSWHDCNPAEPGSGAVKFEEVGGIAYVTWDGVYNYDGTTAADANTFQFQFELATGQVVIAWQSLASNAPPTGFATGEPFLVGYSPGGASVDPVSADLATELPLQTDALEIAPMRLAATPAAAGSTMVLTTTGIPPFAPGAGIHIGANVLSLGQVNPGVDLGILGAPGCRAYVATLDVLQNMIGTTSTNTAQVPFPAGFPAGLVLFSQSLSLVAPNSLPNGQNAFGMTTSNGLRATTGHW